MVFHVVISAHSYSREMVMRVTKMIRDMLWSLNNSLKLAFKEIYGNKSREFVCWYWGSRAWWPIEAVFREILASGPGQNSDPWCPVHYNYCYSDATSKENSNNLGWSLESSDKEHQNGIISVDWSDQYTYLWTAYRIFHFKTRYSWNFKVEEKNPKK